ncbi:hypothetical protein WSM22_36190 [Cytophagales bacterium WSM2-2]|nr:hypothetical protein WSM22_36190 [Cytophagales bacterium WSM2-2]
MKIFFTLLILMWLPLRAINGQPLPGFKPANMFQEQQLVIEDAPPDTRILINAPSTGLEKNKPLLLILYALPNGNTIEQTFGKTMKPGDDWHYDIQHIGAQTRFLRSVLHDQIIVVAYLQARQKSWSVWKNNNPGFQQDIVKLVDSLTTIFSPWNTQVMLSGHSGGGRFIFSYLESNETLPNKVGRIAFLDSNYGYEDSIHGPRLTKWLKSGKKKSLSVLAYNDSVVIYNDKPLVSPTGGTWYRSKMMKDYLAKTWRFKKKDQDSLVWHTSRKKTIEIILKTNPTEKIYHTVQVERNGFIHCVLSGSKQEQKQYTYFGKRAYSGFIADSIAIPIRWLNIPGRTADAEPGSAFMKRVAPLSREEREVEIYKALAAGNMPEFLRKTVTLQAQFMDSAGRPHRVMYEVMPDYLAVGSDADYCRVPMNPHTAQQLASRYGASLITPKLSDHIYQMAEVKLDPFFYKPVGNANETVEKFVAHNEQIEKQKGEAGAKNGQLIAGIKKDVVLSARIGNKPNKVVIYGWHKPDGLPIQPVYGGHVDWYVDYSHGIRLMNNQVVVDGKFYLVSSILEDPLLYKIFSNEDVPIKTFYDR